MPYSPPTSPTSTARNHRRSFTNERGPGAFTSLGALPRHPRRSLPSFHFGDNHHSSSSEESEDESAPPVKARRHAPAAGLHVDTGPIPFPRASTPSPSSPKRISQTHSQPPNRSSSVLFLSNGKPLKSSLKSRSSSSPTLMGTSSHIRSRSAPSTPSLGIITPSASSDEDSGATTPKSVHFDDHLETVRRFKRSGKPAHLLTMSDTETESDQVPESFPFPIFSAPVSLAKYILHADPIPSIVPVRGVVVEDVHLDGFRLVGSLLVTNISYVKDVTVRFTLDDWRTTSEVLGEYKSSIDSLPSSFKREDNPGENDSWDRFVFTIKLEDYAATLATRTLYLAARYAAAGQEWWDNNGGRNYCLQFTRGAFVISYWQIPRFTNSLAYSKSHTTICRSVRFFGWIERVWRVHQPLFW